VKFGQLQIDSPILMMQTFGDLLELRSRQVLELQEQSRFSGTKFQRICSKPVNFELLISRQAWKNWVHLPTHQ
jgi:hypothetical protein